MIGEFTMSAIQERLTALTRRHFFARGALGLGTAALASLMPKREAKANEGTPVQSLSSIGGLPGLRHYARKANRAIYLFMSEGPSQMDMWDYKPKMAAMFDKDLPQSIIAGQRLTTMTSGQARLPIAPSKYKFTQHGKAGTWASELVPWTARIVDDLALVRSVHTEAI